MNSWSVETLQKIEVSLTRKLFDFLKQPYPFKYSTQYSVWLAAGIGFFIFLFLFIFQPFGLHKLKQTYPSLIILGYGIITFLVVLTFQLVPRKIFPRIFTEENWKVLYEIFQILLTVVAIGLGNTYYTCWLGIARLNSENIFVFQIYTLLIGIFPISFTVAFRQFLLLKKNLKKARELSQQLKIVSEGSQLSRPEVPMLTISDENEKENVCTNIADLLFVKSVGNYVEVYCADRDRIRKTLLRSTLTRVESKLAGFNFIIRCHRTYLINLKNIYNYDKTIQVNKYLLR